MASVPNLKMVGGFGDTLVGTIPPAPRPEPDAGLVEQTRLEIRNLAAEIAELSRSDIAPTEFYDRFLPRVVAALGAIGGAIWTTSESGELTLAYQINLAKAQLDTDEHRLRHQRLLQRGLVSVETVLVPPRSGTGDGQDAGNPTNCLLLLGPMSDGQQPVGVIEIFQRTDAGPATQRGYVRFLSQMVELASDYAKNQRLRHYTDKQQLWQQLERFIRTVHRELNPRATAFTIASEGRRLIGCDRVSVLLKRGGRWRMEVVSGLDNVEQRARSVRLLTDLTSLVAATGEPLWHYGSDRDLAPQLENAVHEFVDETHASAIAVVPLRRPQSEDSPEENREKTPLIAAIVVEQLQGEALAAGFKQRVGAVADHGAAALANALDHDSIFMLPLLTALGKAQSIVAMRNLPKSLLALGGLGALAAAMIVMPASFDLEGRGTLEPVVRREVFAAVDGIVAEVPVEHGQSVAAGQTLVELRSTSDLDVAVADLIGKKLATRERMAAIERALLGEQRVAVDEQDRLSGQLFQLRKTAQSIDAQLELYEQKRLQLVVASPIDGLVMTWHVQDRLLHRPVRKGQSLLTVVDANDAWELELHMPERRMGHIGRAAAKFDEPLEVKFMLATHPGEEFVGTVKEIDRVADDAGDEGPTVLVRVAVDKEQLPDLRPGASVTGRIDCGTRPLGYVWFHDVWEFVQTQILFRL